MTQEELDSLMAQDADSLGEGLDDVQTEDTKEEIDTSVKENIKSKKIPDTKLTGILGQHKKTSPKNNGSI